MSSTKAKPIGVETDEQRAQLERVRTQFLEQANEIDNYKRDLEMVARDEWWTLRFLKWNHFDEEAALAQMIAAFAWRRSFGLLDVDRTNDVPLEFIQAGAIFPCGFDHRGRPIIVIRIKVYRKVARLSHVFRLFVASIVDRTDCEAGTSGFVFLFDLSDMGIAAVDFDFLQFLIDLTQKYYPYGLRYTICYNLTRFLKPFWLMARPFLGGAAQRFRFVSSGVELRELVPKEHLLRYMGGESDFDFTRDFEEMAAAKPVHELAEKFGFTDQEVNKYVALFEPSIREAAKLIKSQKALKVT